MTTAAVLRTRYAAYFQRYDDTNEEKIPRLLLTLKKADISRVFLRFYFFNYNFLVKALFAYNGLNLQSSDRYGEPREKSGVLPFPQGQLVVV